METDEFNKMLKSEVEEFIQAWIGLVDQYAEENELSPNHKLTTFLYSHLGIERELSERVWRLGAEYMEAVIEVGKEILKNDSD